MVEEKIRILFVDDDPFFSDLGQETLSESGFAVTAAANGKDALALIATERFDLVLLDNEMPGLSGFEVIHRMRRLENGADVPVIMVTGSDDQESINKAFKVGADSFLAKPFDWSLLVHQANFVLKAARSTKELREALETQKLLQTMQERFVRTLISEGQKPLKTAVNFARIMKSEPDGPLGSDFYRTCVAEISQALECVNSMLVKLVHRSDLGGQVATLDEGTHSLVNLSKEVNRWVNREAHRRDIEVVTGGDIAGDIRVLCDRVLLVYAVKTVIHNSINLSPRSSKLSVTVNCDVERGIHIAIDDQAAVHSRAGAASAETEGGPAVPLALQTSNMVIEAHSGHLKRSHREDGGRIEIILPAERLSLATDDDGATQSETLSVEHSPISVAR